MHTIIHTQNRVLRELIRQFVVQMDSGIPYERTELLDRRIDFSRKFHAYLAALDTMVKAAQPDAADLPLIRAARDFSTAARLLLCDYSAHLQHWTPREITADWAGYCTAVRGLQTGLLALFDRQENSLLPLLAPARRSAA